MVSYLMLQMLVDSLGDGPPYKVCMRPIQAMRHARILIELESRGLITSGPSPELTEAGVAEAEAKWFASCPAKTKEMIK
jgi:hypothetical protein